MRLIDRVANERNQNQKTMTVSMYYMIPFSQSLGVSKSMKMGLMLIIKVNINFEGLLTRRNHE